MAFLGNGSLNTLLGDNGNDIISDFDGKRIKNGAYELSLGGEVFQTDGPRGVKNLRDNDHIEINPGQFALLLTKETVKIPQDLIAFISIKAGVKFKGLVNVSGFHVDPGFEGKLLFSVYNAGPANIVLTSGKPYFPIWFASLDGKQEYKGEHEKQSFIPTGAIESLSQGELVSPNILNKKIDQLKSDLDKQITGIEKDQKANNYLMTTVVALGITILMTMGFKVFDEKCDKQRESDMRKKEISADSMLNESLKERKKLLQVIDSLENRSQ